MYQILALEIWLKNQALKVKAFHFPQHHCHKPFRVVHPSRSYHYGLIQVNPQNQSESLRIEVLDFQSKCHIGRRNLSLQPGSKLMTKVLMCPHHKGLKLKSNSQSRISQIRNRRCFQMKNGENWKWCTTLRKNITDKITRNIGTSVTAKSQGSV